MTHREMSAKCAAAFPKIYEYLRGAIAEGRTHFTEEDIAAGSGIDGIPLDVALDFFQKRATVKRLTEKEYELAARADTKGTIR